MEQKLAAAGQKANAMKHDFDLATTRLRDAIEHWKQTHQLAQASIAMA